MKNIFKKIGMWILICVVIAVLIGPLAEAKISSTKTSGESKVDVIVKFTGKDWTKAKNDPAWATKMVINELEDYKSKPEKYFATKPSWAVKAFSWKTRIRMEVSFHIGYGDPEMRFSEWWLSKRLWD